MSFHAHHVVQILLLACILGCSRKSGPAPITTEAPGWGVFYPCPTPDPSDTTYKRYSISDIDLLRAAINQPCELFEQDTLAGMLFLSDSPATPNPNCLTDSLVAIYLTALGEDLPPSKNLEATVRIGLSRAGFVSQEIPLPTVVYRELYNQMIVDTSYTEREQYLLVYNFVHRLFRVDESVAGYLAYSIKDSPFILHSVLNSHTSCDLIEGKFMTFNQILSDRFGLYGR